MCKHITLSKNQYFEVVSKVTGRELIVIGLGIKNNQVVEYAIKNEGWWDATRFLNFGTADEKAERLEEENVVLKKQKEIMANRLDKLEKKLEQINEILDDRIIKIKF